MQWTAPIQRHRDDCEWLQGDQIRGRTKRLVYPRNPTSKISVSAFALNSNMAFMTAVTIIFAIVADFLLLPPLLMAIDGKSTTRNANRERPTAAFDGKEQTSV